MVTKGRFQTVKNQSTHHPTKFSVVDTSYESLGERFMCATDTEKKADHIAHALNFNTHYGFRMVD